MKIKVFTLAFDAERRTFDDAPVQAFLENRQALSLSEHFFLFEQTPILTLTVTFRDLPRPGDPKPPVAEPHDWKAELDPAEVPAFEALRSWRAGAAKRDGVAPYILCTNRQAAEMARKRPATREALAAIGGFGESRVARWGEEMLKVLGSAPGPTPAPDKVVPP
jgi:superfamily II DNA helicase RecQ